MSGCIPQRRAPALFAALLLLTWDTATLAHEDPLGDVHPRVKVNDKNFVVEFSDNSKWSRGPTQKRYWVLLSPIGEVLQHRREVEEPSAAEKQKWPKIRLPSGNLTEDGKRGYIFPNGGDLEGAPHYYDIGEPGDRPRKIPLPLGLRSKQTYRLNGASVKNGAVAVLLNLVSLEDGRRSEAEWTEARTLYLYYIAPGANAPLIHKIGIPASIYMFPICSQPVEDEGNYLVSWVQEREDDDYRCRLILTRWNRATNTATDEVLTDRINSNTEVSMNRIGKDLLIAYHWRAPDEPRCRIHTVHVALE